MPDHVVHDLLESFRRHADRAALIYGGRTWRYAELGNTARRYAAWLQEIGTNPGDRVALFTPNKLPFLIGHLGVLFAGAVPLPLNPRFTREEMRYFLSDSGARLMIAGSEQQSMAAGLAKELPHRPAVIADSMLLNQAGSEWQEPTLEQNNP